MARDLHDILGHSLTVVTVNAQLANRLLDADADRARARARAREALRAAGIDADLPGSTDTVPTRLRELFAWTIRETVTNVVRHSGATRCAVTVDARQVEIVDNGPGPAAVSGGNGWL